MIGFPKILKTKQDYLNAVAYSEKTGEEKDYLISRFMRMLESTTYNGLKDEAYSMRPEKQHQENYEKKYDVNCLMNYVGFTEKEIKDLICRLGGKADV